MRLAISENNGLQYRPKGMRLVHHTEHRRTHQTDNDKLHKPVRGKSERPKAQITSSVTCRVSSSKSIRTTGSSALPHAMKKNYIRRRKVSVNASAHGYRVPHRGAIGETTV
jgi:hypothetical protein